MERGGIDLLSLTETRRTKIFSNNQHGYDVRRAAERPSRANRAQGGVGMGTQDQLNGREREVTRFHRMNMVSCERVRMMSDG